MAKRSQVEFQRQKEEQEKAQRDSADELVRTINLVEQERKAAKDLETKLKDELEQKRVEL